MVRHALPRDDAAAELDFLCKYGRLLGVYLEPDFTANLQERLDVSEELLFVLGEEQEVIEPLQHFLDASVEFMGEYYLEVVTRIATALEKAARGIDADRSFNRHH